MEDSRYLRMEDLFMEADRLIGEQKIGEAFSKLTAIVQEMPEFGKAHNHLGWIYEIKYKNYAEAEKHYKMAIESSPDYHAAYYNYATVLSILNKWDELKALLDQALKIPGINKGSIWNEYAIMYETLGKYKEAIDAYKNYVMNSLDNKQIETAKGSIERCKNKLEILNM